MTCALLPSAQRELDQAIAYYDQQVNGLGDVFLNEVFEAIDLICLYPQGWPLITKISRKCPLHKFPYLILYGVIDNVIVVSAVAHQHRKPESYLR